MFLVDLLKDSLGERVELSTSFIQNGGNSLKAISLAFKCRSHGYKIPREAILTCSSLQDLVETFAPSATTRLEPESPTPGSDVLLLAREKVSSISANASSNGDSLEFYDVSHDTQTVPVEAACVDPENTSSTAVPSFESSHATSVFSESEDSESANSMGSSTWPEDLLTEMQMSMIHGTLSSGTSNMITHKETYYTDDIPAVKAAWAKVLGAEPILQGDWFRAFAPEKWDTLSEGDGLTNTSEARHDAVDKRYQGCIGSFLEVASIGVGKDGRELSTITWIVHHAFIDGYSSHLVFTKVARALNGLDTKPGASFWDWARSLRRYQQERKSDGDEFWRRKAEKHGAGKGELMLPAPGEPAKASASAVETHTCSIHADVLSHAQDLGLTPAIVFHAAWALVLATYADSDDITFGAVLSGRNLPIPGSLDVVGPLLNVVPLNVGLDRDAAAKEFMQSLFRDILELEAFSWTAPDNGFSRQYESALSVEMATENSDEYPIRPLETSTAQPSDVPLSIMVDSNYNVKFQYHSQRFSSENMERISHCYGIAVDLLLLRPHLKVGAVLEGLLSSASNSMLMRFGNCHSGLTNRPSVKEDLVTLFERCASSIPENIAVDNGSTQVGYRDMDLAASRVALKLSETIAPGDAVCVHADKSINWIIAIFGVLKAGGVYAPLDSALPAELRRSMYSLAGAKAFIMPSTAQLDLSPAPRELSFSVESILQEAKDSEPPGLEHRVVPQPWSSAYICFTSGSTGTPKGVVCTHAGLVAFQTDLEVRLNAQPGVRVSQIMSVAFDGSIHEIFSALTHGATLVLPCGADPLSPLDSVDSALLTPSIARVLSPEDYPRLKWVYVVGEPVPQNVSDVWGFHKRLFNMYGPTEATCGATIKRLRPGEPITIGAPNPTTRVYILNSKRSLCQPGMIGEIFLAGVQVSKGYLDMPEQTSERFHRDSVMGNLEMMYQTGDRGYWNEAGEVVCLGRNDRQIKLRGYRLDLNDLEVRIARAAPSLQAVAIARHDDELIAMVQPSSISSLELRARLRPALQHYAMPHHFIPVERIPTTKAGKIDYKAVIAQWQRAPPRHDDDGEPATSTEKMVAVALRAVLGLSDDEYVSRSAHFSSLGGHSLAQIRLAARLSADLGVRVPPKVVISQPTVQGLALAMDKFLESATKTAASTETLGSERVSPIEQEWLEKYDIHGSACFNVSFAADFEPGSVDTDRLARAWNAVLGRHRLFSCRYKMPRRRHQAPVRMYTSHPPRAEPVARLDLWNEVNRPFQLDREPPVRIIISATQLLVVMSHIVADYTTMSVLLREAAALYGAGADAGALPAPTRAYSDVSLWHEPAPADHRDFWTEYLASYAPPPAALLGPPRRDPGGYAGHSALYLFTPASACRIASRARSAGVTLQQLSLAAVAVALSDPRPDADTDIVLGAPHMNRRTLEDAETVGLFLEPIPVRIRHPAAGAASSPSPSSSSSSSFPEEVRSSVQSAISHAIPWHQLLAALSIRPAYPAHPIFDVMVSFHDTALVESLAMPGLPQLRPRYVWSQGAKFQLMAEFVRLAPDRLLLRLEHDAGCAADAAAAVLVRIARAMDGLARGMGVAEIKERVGGEEGWEGVGEQVEAEAVFGRRVCDF